MGNRRRVALHPMVRPMVFLRVAALAGALWTGLPSLTAAASNSPSPPVPVGSPTTSTTPHTPTTEPATRPTVRKVTTSTSRPTTTVPAQALLSSAMRAFAGQRAVVWTYRLAAFGRTLTETVHAGRADGTESDLLVGSGGTGRVELVLDGALYFEGNAAGLGEDLNFGAAAASDEANRWIAVPRGSAEFATMTAGITVSSAAQQLYIGGSVTSLPPTTVNRQSVLGFRESTRSGGFEISQKVYVRATGTPLPVEIAQEVNGLPATIVYGPWGRPPDAKVPVNAIVFQSTWVNKQQPR